MSLFPHGITSRCARFGAALAACLLVTVAAPLPDFTAPFGVSARSAAAESPAPLEPVLVKIHADWCPLCQGLARTFATLESLPDLGARIVVLDVTDAKKRAAAKEQAEALGLGDFFERYGDRSGTVAVLRGQPPEVVAMLPEERDIAAYRTVIERAKTPENF